MAFIMKQMTKEQQDLITDNNRLMQSFIEKRLAIGIVPIYIEDDFISDMGWRFCISALKYNRELGFKFSTYAYGGFKLCWKHLKDRTENSYIRNNFYPISTVKKIMHKSSEHINKKIHIDRETLCYIIKKAHLTVKEIIILQDYYFDKQSMEIIGRRFGVSRERISQIMKKILFKIKSVMFSKKLTITDFYGA